MLVHSSQAFELYIKITTSARETGVSDKGSSMKPVRRNMSNKRWNDSGIKNRGANPLYHLGTACVITDV